MIQQVIAKYLGELYRQDEKFRLSKADRLKDIKETKSLIDQRRKAKAVLLQGQPGPYEFQMVAKLEEEIAVLSTLLPKRGRPADLLGGLVANLALFVKEKTGKFDWELIGEAAAKNIQAVAEPRLWAYKLAKRFWRRQPKGLPTKVEIIIEPAVEEPRKILH
jgi:hypothetical protein